MNWYEYKTLCSHGLVSEKDMETMTSSPVPRRFCGRSVPSDLNALTMGQLAEMTQVPEGGETDLARIILEPWRPEPTNMAGKRRTERMTLRMRRLYAWRVLRSDAGEAAAFFAFVASEVRRISMLFESCALPPTPDEVAAGCGQLRFGIFGTIDWYARRMGITSHDEVMAVPWTVIWQCTKNDNMKAAYEERLAKVIRNRKK